jgi:hypothetical protein
MGLVENEQRIRQAVRNIKAMMKVPEKFVKPGARPKLAS